jgi:anti-sigma factor RsiW
MSCDRVDEFLDGDLHLAVEISFRQHLEGCLHCRRLVAQFEQLGRKLNQAASQVDVVPVDLIPRIQARLIAKSRRRVLAATGLCGLAAALAIVLGQLWRERVTCSALPPEPVLVEQTRPKAPVQIAFADQSKVLVVPEETGSPDVTFVWVFPNQHKTSQ